MHGEKSIIPNSLPPFTFQQVDLSFIEFRALPGPEGRALRGKTIGSVISDFGFLVFLDHLQN